MNNCPRAAFHQNVWATERLLDARAGLSPELLQRAATGDYGGVRATLHTW